MASARQRKFDEPRSLRQAIKLAVPATNQQLAEIRGSFTGVDVWIEVDSNAWATAGFALFAVNGKSRVRLINVLLAAVPQVLVAGGRISALVASVRGRPCDAFVVEQTVAMVGPGPAADPGGTIHLEAFGDCCVGPNDDISVAWTALTPGSAALLAVDNMENPTAPQQLVYLYGYDGATWDRLRVVGTGSLSVTEAQAAAAEDNSNGVFAMADKPLAASTYSWSKDIDFSASNARVVKASAGNIGGIHGFNGNAAQRFLQIHNKATAINAGDVPFESFPVATQQTIQKGLDWWGSTGMHLSVGVAWGWSTTLATFTAATAADHSTITHYK